MTKEYPQVETKGYKLNVYGKSVNGCVRHYKDIMITWCIPPEEESHEIEFVDSFLTQQQAKDLVQKLQRCIVQNEKDNII